MSIMSIGTEYTAGWVDIEPLQVAHLDRPFDTSARSVGDSDVCGWCARSRVAENLRVRRNVIVTRRT